MKLTPVRCEPKKESFLSNRNTPHVLVIGATHSRTLAIIFSRDLDISVIDEVRLRNGEIKNCVVDVGAGRGICILSEAAGGNEPSGLCADLSHGGASEMIGRKMWWITRKR